MNILYKHELSIVDFLHDFSNAESRIGKYQDKITAAYLDKDAALLEEIYLHFKYEDARTKRLLKFLVDELNGIATKKQFKQLNYIFFKQNKWDEETLWLLFHIMDWYEMNDLQELVDAVIKRCNSKNTNARLRQLMIRITIRYLDICFKRGEKNKVDTVFDFLKFLPNTADMRMYKIIAVYYDKLFGQKYDEASDIANLLKEI